MTTFQKIPTYLKIQPTRIHTSTAVEKCIEQVRNNSNVMKYKKEQFPLDESVSKVNNITEKYSIGVADYDGYALFTTIFQPSYKGTYDMFLDMVKYINDNGKTGHSCETYFSNWNETDNITLIHDLGLDPNSDDCIAILILRAAKIILGDKLNIHMVSVAGSDDTRKLRAAYANQIMGGCLAVSEYLPVQNNITPLPFIKGTPMEMFGSSATDVTWTTKWQSGYVFICGHVEKNESNYINQLIPEDAMIFAQTTENGNFNLGENDPLLSKCVRIQGQPHTLNWDFYNNFVPDYVQAVNGKARVGMLTSEIGSMTRLITDKKGLPQLSSAYTRAMVISDGINFYDTLHEEFLG